MRFWRVLVMAGLSMLVVRALLGTDLPVRTDGDQNAIVDLALLAGYVNAATWAIAGALVAVVWVVGAVAPWVPQLQYHGYMDWNHPTIKLRFDAYGEFWRDSPYPGYGWEWLRPPINFAPIVVACLALISPVREIVPWLGVVGIAMVLVHLWKYQRFPA